ncbi:hypothetical protein Avbf_18350 [Armadillidium vulgare]|nr:hypothetical protein Avbf_18350 [Armadillidium vulgare]
MLRSGFWLKRSREQDGQGCEFYTTIINIRTAGIRIDRDVLLLICLIQPRDEGRKTLSISNTLILCLLRYTYSKNNLRISSLLGYLRFCSMSPSYIYSRNSCRYSSLFFISNNNYRCPTGIKIFK